MTGGSPDRHVPLGNWQGDLLLSYAVFVYTPMHIFRSTSIFVEVIVVFVVMAVVVVLVVVVVVVEVAAVVVVVVVVVVGGLVAAVAEQ